MIPKIHEMPNMRDSFIYQPNRIFKDELFAAIVCLVVCFNLHEVIMNRMAFMHNIKPTGIRKNIRSDSH
jgi:hypothetical protein